MQTAGRAANSLGEFLEALRKTPAGTVSLRTTKPNSVGPASSGLTFLFVIFLVGSSLKEFFHTENTRLLTCGCGFPPATGLHRSTPTRARPGNGCV